MCDHTPPCYFRLTHMHTDGRLTLRTGGKGRKNQAAHSVLHIGASLCSSEAFRTNKNNDVVSESGVQNSCKHAAAI